MIRDLVDKNDPILREEMPVFDFDNTEIDPIELYTDLAETMIEHGGIGLSANQIGVRARMFVLRAEEVIGMINPKVVDFSTEKVILEEGCLSYPRLFVKIKRPKSILVRYTEPNGNILSRQFDGMTARAIQHELDHLNGVIYTKRANSIHLDQAKKNMKKLMKYPLVPQSKMSNEAKELMEWLK